MPQQRLDERLRRSAAHVVVADLDAPQPDDGDWHHLRRVSRLRDGEAVTVTDGAGGWRVCRCGPGELSVDGEIVRSPAPPTITIAAAAPKGDRLEWMVAKCTELGVSEVVLLTTERSVVSLTGERGTKQLDRLRRIARESSMQARRVWLPTISGPLTVAELLTRFPECAIAEPDGRPPTARDRVVAIGPEGGWSAAELDRFAPARRVGLAGTVLRVETAAVTAAAVLAVAGGPR